jgi:hypothetical protein
MQPGFPAFLWISFIQTRTQQLQALPTTIAVPAWQPPVDETKEGQKPIPCPESWKPTEAGEVRQERLGCFSFRHAFLFPSPYRSLRTPVCFIHVSFSTGRNKNLVFSVSYPQAWPLEDDASNLAPHIHHNLGWEPLLRQEKEERQRPVRALQLAD